jgi:hypothetical protein
MSPVSQRSPTGREICDVTEAVVTMLRYGTVAGGPLELMSSSTGQHSSSLSRDPNPDRAEYR